MASKKTTSKQKAPAKKKAAKPVVKKASAPPKPASTTKVKKMVTAKTTVKKAPAKSPEPAQTAKPAAEAKGRPAAARPVVKKASGAARKAEEFAPEAAFKSQMNKKELDYHKDLLLKFRDRIIDEMNFLAKDNLNRSGKDGAGDLSSYSFHMADQGTDNFDREFAANLLSGEQDVLYEIEEALRRIEGGTYGICEMSGKPIERERLKVIPYARYCVTVQSQMERGKPRFRPFKRTSIQQSSAGEG